VSIAADEASAIEKNVQFRVIDLGQGRVALKSSNGLFISADAENAILKDLAGAAPGDAETFQWINMMRGDMTLMSVVNHRYLVANPNNPGQVSITATGPTPARKSGECFNWKAIE
jgi:hypothetical protein